MRSFTGARATRFRKVAMQRERPLAAWALIPDMLNDQQKPNRFGPFITSLVSFFLAEMGDKTQFATVAIAIAAKYASLTMMLIGTTLGMMAASVPDIAWGASGQVCSSV